MQRRPRRFIFLNAAAVYVSAVLVLLTACTDAEQSAAKGELAGTLQAAVARIDERIARIDLVAAELESRAVAMPESTREAARDVLRDAMDERADIVRLKEEISQSSSYSDYAAVKEDLREEYRDVESLLSRADQIMAPE